MNTSLDYLTINETQALLKEVSDPRDKAIITKFLTTGLFVNELLELKLEDIDLETKTLKIAGNRKREISLNEQAYEALVSWTKTRVETPTPYLFITQKGKVQNLSVRGIDKLIHKYSKRAGFKRKINAKLLRNTFAVNLFSKDISIKEAGDILGISDFESIKRYQVAAKDPSLKKELPGLEHTDTRPMPTKILSKIFPLKPKKTKSKSPRITITANPEEVIFGRDSVTNDIEASLKKTQSILIVGPLGIGKTHLLKYLTNKEPSRIFVSMPCSIKDLFTKICDSLNPDWQTDLGSRASTKAIFDYIQTKAETRSDLPVLVIDNLHKFRGADLESILTLLKNFTVLGSAEELVGKYKQLWWKFKVLNLNPLTEDSSRSLIHYLTQNISISDYDLLETKLLNLANGYPSSIVDMTKQLSYRNVVTRSDVRGLYHEAGVQYRDWTFALIVLWGLVLMSRFIALGSHSFEGYILAGIGTSVLVVVRFFVFRMR